MYLILDFCTFPLIIKSIFQSEDGEMGSAKLKQRRVQMNSPKNAEDDYDKKQMEQGTGNQHLKPSFVTRLCLVLGNIHHHCGVHSFCLLKKNDNITFPTH